MDVKRLLAKSGVTWGRHVIDRRGTLQMERRQILKILDLATVARVPAWLPKKPQRTASNHIHYASGVTELFELVTELIFGYG